MIQAEALEKLTDNVSDAVKILSRVVNDIESLKKENQELKERINELETEENVRIARNFGVDL